jgi:hypothetical protein
MEVWAGFNCLRIGCRGVRGQLHRRESAHDTHWTGDWVSTIVGVDAVKLRTSLHLLETEPWFSRPQPVNVRIQRQ